MRFTYAWISATPGKWALGSKSHVLPSARTGPVVSAQRLIRYSAEYVARRSGSLTVMQGPMSVQAPGSVLLAML